MSVNDQCFVAQIADEKILLHVTNVCGECYRDMHEGDPIYYDMMAYRYVCSACAERLSEEMGTDRVSEENELSSAGLFGS